MKCTKFQFLWMFFYDVQAIQESSKIIGMLQIIKQFLFIQYNLHSNRGSKNYTLIVRNYI